MDDDYSASSYLEGCPHCRRSFNPDSLVRHVKICQKSSMKKRKVFDSGKQRAQGSDIPINKTLKPGLIPRHQDNRSTMQTEKASKSNWRAKHEDFIETIRAARGVTCALKSGGPLPPPPKPAINPDYVQCPYCSRRFNETAAERHMPFCKEQHDRIGNKPPVSAQAKARANARTMYKPPRLKSKTQQNGSTSSPGYGSGFGYSPSGSKPPPGRPTGSAKSTGRTTKPDMSTLTVRHDSSDGGALSYANMKKSSSTGQVSDPNYGRPMRTGRSPQTYEDAKKSVRTTGVAGRAMAGPRNDISPSYGSSYGQSTPPSGYRRGTYDNTTNNRRCSTAKFCHECGTKYPVANAKFCCECGVRKLSAGGSRAGYGY